MRSSKSSTRASDWPFVTTHAGLAVSCREKQLLVAGLQAFQGAVHAAHELRRLLALRAEMFAEWRRLAASSPRHWDLVLAANQRRRWLLRSALAAWRVACAETAQQ